MTERKIGKNDNIKIVHTADIHLSEYGDERWQALQEVFNLAAEKEADIVAISGDLFDGNPDAERLRPKIREIFTGNRFKVIIIPGNHDYLSLRTLPFYELN